MSLEEALQRRRSIRHFRAKPLSLEALSQLLWAAQGTTSSEGFRSAPSAGALYLIEVYVAVGDVKSLEAGIYRYVPSRHQLVLVADSDRRTDLAHASLDQNWIAQAPAILVIAAVTARTTREYGERGMRYVHMEVGHAAQNVYLQATAHGLGTTVVGSFRDADVKTHHEFDARRRTLCDPGRRARIELIFVTEPRKQGAPDLPTSLRRPARPSRRWP
jgi:SagB-type dehydrogenase family enzyme